MCCGNKRLALRNTSLPARPSRAIRVGSPDLTNRVPAAVTNVKLPPSPMREETTEAPEMLVQGPITGRLYAFTPGRSAEPMDPRDGAALMRGEFVPE